MLLNLSKKSNMTDTLIVMTRESEKEVTLRSNLVSAFFSKRNNRIWPVSLIACVCIYLSTVNAMGTSRL